MVILEFLKRLWSEARRAHKAAVDRRARFRVAKIFNTQHTFSGLRIIDGRWMCPTCLKVHVCIGSSPFGGPQYPACCEHEQGARLDKAHASRF